MRKNSFRTDWLSVCQPTHLIPLQSVTPMKVRRSQRNRDFLFSVSCFLNISAITLGAFQPLNRLSRILRPPRNSSNISNKMPPKHALIDSSKFSMFNIKTSPGRSVANPSGSQTCLWRDPAPPAVFGHILPFVVKMAQEDIIPFRETTTIGHNATDPSDSLLRVHRPPFSYLTLRLVCND